MNYREVEIESMTGKQKHIIVEIGDNAFKSFPADPENPEYKLFLEALSQEQ